MNKKRVAHFSIPFYNGGGLVKYVKDLTYLQQTDEEIEYVCIFMPGSYTLLKKNIFISSENSKGIDIFSINNFNPTTLLEGTRYPLKDIENIQLENVIAKKLIELNIDIVHFHTFFGLSSNLLKIIHDKGIKVIYTAHDHQPLCTKTTLLNYKGCVCMTNELIDCANCNSNALSDKKLFLRYSKLSNQLKKFNGIKSKIKSIVSKKNNYNTEKMETKLNNKDYEKRINSFVKNLNEYCDLIIYSSTMTKNIFSNFGVNIKNEVIIPISNLNITQNIESYNVELNHLNYKLGFLGGDRPEKGYKMLINSLSDLYEENITNWELIILGQGAENINLPSNIEKNVIIKGYVEKGLYDDFDILIVPSICPETFNFVVIEGMSNKKLIIASNIVGSADLYKNNGIITYNYDNEYGLYNELKEILLKKNIKHKVDLGSNQFNESLNFISHYNKIKNVYNFLLYRRPE